MKTKLFYSLCGALLLGAVSCSTQRVAPISALEGEWNITDVKGSQTPDSENTPYLGFNVATGQLTGYLGCNRLTGSFSTNLAPGKIDFSKAGSTKMMCPDMASEDAILSVLPEAVAFKVKGNKASLYNAEGLKVMSLSRRVPDFTVANLKGIWQIVEVAGKELDSTNENPCEISFDPKEMAFNCTTNCNSIGGNYDGKYASARFDVSMMTRMSCPDMSLEQTLATTIPEIRTLARLDSGRVVFYNAAGDIVLAIVPLP